MTGSDWRARLVAYLRSHHPRVSVDDLEPSGTPGYWDIKTACGGAAGGCRAYMHGTLFNEGPMHHTISYFDRGRGEHGQFATPYRTWREARARFETACG